MNRCEYDGNVLPLTFQCKIEPKKRISVLKTLTSNVVQTRPYTETDEIIVFSDTWVPVENRNLFLNAYKNGSVKILRDYDGNEFDVTIIEYSEEELPSITPDKVWYKISGKMQKVEV